MFSRSVSQIAKTSVRGISTSSIRSDVARVTLVGRLGADPVIRTSEKTGTQYCVYPIATSTGPLGPADEQGNRADPPTSWHSVWSFQEFANKKLLTLGKGSTVYVEADLTMKEQPAEEGQKRGTATPFLLHRTIQVINRQARADGETTE
ncbi:hypothetical protein FFLO_03898 [Filobasidium floriforme]|uniref:Single-stranded DNA-binding protein n=1 Tax=Filobasidium floriforme TaxID=5210 RepID=A0A8K0NPS3_9TREE|nr:uncharacterized protein HD553DRAFT_310757 [Filobasidium floriforme]KAG7532023.1 hypothetical protein FFLO_03898 [Filobasidium floriforme]KAH8085199.1 hypothetical protein HD553DRAFT_310757 [Filobasidium floriforme]